MEPEVSVVTPFYNTSEFLAECIESVLNQTYTNWEYVLVNNCSSDGSAEIASLYAVRFPGKIRLIHADMFRSQVANFNYALSQISNSSKYCKMVLADDWIYPECIEKMVGVAEADSSIGIVSSYRLKGSRVLGEGLEYRKTMVPGPDICRLHLINGLFLFGTPSTVMYRSEMIRSNPQFFDEKTLHDDTDTCFRMLRHWNFAFVHQVLSFSRVNDESVMAQAKSYKPELLDRFLQISKFGPEYLDSAEYSHHLSAIKTQYYRFLANAALRSKGAGFWTYHVCGLRSGGLRLEPSTVLRYFCLEILNLILNPASIVKAIFRRLSQVAKRQLAGNVQVAE